MHPQVASQILSGVFRNVTRLLRYFSIFFQINNLRKSFSEIVTKVFFVGNGPL